MPEILQYSFMVRALGAGMLVALVVPLLGSFLVARRYSLISDSLAHVSLAGIGAGLLLGYAPVLTAIPVAVGGALILEWLRQHKRMSGDIGLAILMSGGLALAVVFANLAHGANTNFSNYLFGSIATTTSGDLLALAVAGAGILAFILYNYRALLHIAFDEDSARIAGHRVALLNYALAAITAVVVVLSLRIVGGLLISALLVVPVVSGSQIARSFLGTMLWGVMFAIAAVLAGLIIAFYAGIAAGGAIVLASLSLLAFTMIWKR